MHTKKSSLEVQPEGFPVIWIPKQKYSTWRKHMEEKQLFENLNSINMEFLSYAALLFYLCSVESEGMILI